MIPSRGEAFGKISVEAQLAGTPVVVADKTGLVDTMIAGVTGEIFENGSAAGLSVAMLKVLNDIDVYRQGIASNEDFFIRFSPAIVMSSLLGDGEC